jgi:hypothetical protein
MELLKKVELLLEAKARRILPRRERRSVLDQQEEALLAEIRQALQEVETKEQELAGRIKKELVEADAAAQRNDLDNQRAHERRAAELEHYLTRESTMAINLEEKLAALEEKLALAKDAVEKQAKDVKRRDEEASKVLAQGGLMGPAQATTEPAVTPAGEEIIPDDFADDDPEVAARKSRLSGNDE